MSLRLNSSGGGSVTLQEPVTANNQTLTLPDVTGTLLAAGTAISGTTGTFSGDLSFNSGYGSAAIAYGCRAWVNFNGTGTVAIRASGNVSSITDNGTGDYRVNFTTAMPDANYICLFTGGDTAIAANVPIGYITTTTTTAQTIRTYNISPGVLFDCPNINIAIFR